jgi:hypothetical protein
MIQIATGDRIEHEVYGEVEVVGFLTVSDEIEVNELERDGERVLDVVTSVQSDKVEFLDNKGRKYEEPLDVFYKAAEIE